MTDVVTVAEAIEQLQRDDKLTMTEIAAVLRVSERTLYRWIQGGDFPSQGHVDLLNALLKKGKDVAAALDNINEALMESSAEPESKSPKSFSESPDEHPEEPGRAAQMEESGAKNGNPGLCKAIPYLDHVGEDSKNGQDSDVRDTYRHAPGNRPRDFRGGSE